MIADDPKLSMAAASPPGCVNDDDDEDSLMSNDSESSAAVSIPPKGVDNDSRHESVPIPKKRRSVVEENSD